MKNLIKPIQTAGNDRGAGARRTTVKFIALLTLLNWAVVLDFVSAAETPGQQQAAQATAIPWNEIGAAAGKQYQGDGLAVAATGAGARLHCVFQKLEGHATRDGLWLVSTTAGAPGGRFRVTAQAVGRAGGAVAPLPGSGTVRAQDTLVRFERPGLTEEYSASLDGIRQGKWGSVCKNQKILPRRQHRHHRNRSLAFWDKAGGTRPPLSPFRIPPTTPPA